MARPRDSFDDSLAAVAAKRTGKDPELDTWVARDLRAFVRDREWGFCIWPDCGQPGDEMAHIFGKGSGGRRSANTPDNVAWMCRRHHRILDGAPMLFDDARALVASLPEVRQSAGVRVCSWYCDEAPTDTLALRPLCERHHRIATGRQVASGRRTELGLAFSFVVEKRNRDMGLRTS